MLDVYSSEVAPALALPLGEIEVAFRRLTNLVKDLPQAALDYRGPDGTLNSVAMLIAHLTVVDVGYLHAIMGTPVPPELAEAVGPYHDEQGRIPLVEGRPAAELLAQYGRVIDLVRAYLKTKGDDEAARPVTIGWWPQPATVRYVLWHMASHSMFHQGQIARLLAWYREQHGA